MTLTISVEAVLAVREICRACPLSREGYGTTYCGKYKTDSAPRLCDLCEKLKDYRNEDTR